MRKNKNRSIVRKMRGGVNYPDEYDDIVNRNIGTSEDKTLLYIALASDNKNFNLPTNPIYDKMFVSFESKKINPQFKSRVIFFSPWFQPWVI